MMKRDVNEALLCMIVFFYVCVRQNNVHNIIINKAMESQSTN